MSKTRITVEILQSGQPRPYADHVNVGIVTIEMVKYNPDKTVPDEWIPQNIDAEVFKRSPKAQLVCPWYEKGEWYQGKLQGIEKVSPGKFKITVTEAYTD